MICQNCGIKNATSHIHSVVNGVVKDKYLCADCALKYKYSSFSDNDIFKMLSSFMNEGSGQINEPKHCDCCGITLAEISKTGKVGCANCYKVFKKELMPTIVRVHGKTEHIGKRLNSQPEPQNTAQSELENMKKELEIAISNEEYEKAAILRDKIKAYKEEE